MSAGAETEPSQERDPVIDLMRGLAILSVLFMHINIRVPFRDGALGSSMSKSLEAALFWSGYYGVVVFFVISGYLITAASLRRWGRLADVEPRRAALRLRGPLVHSPGRWPSG